MSKRNLLDQVNDRIFNRLYNMVEVQIDSNVDMHLHEQLPCFPHVSSLFGSQVLYNLINKLSYNDELPSEGLASYPRRIWYE